MPTKHHEFKIGIVVVIGTLIILSGLYLTNSLPFLSQGYRIHMKLSYGANVPVGASVKLAGGIKIGRLENVKENPEEGGVILTLFIESRYKINRDAIFVVQSASLVGEKYIDILNYTGNQPYLKDGDVVVGKESGSISETISDVFELLKKIVGKIEATPELPQSIDKIVLMLSYLELILREVNENRTHITTSLRNISELSEQLKKSAHEVNTLLNSLSEVGNNLNKLDVKKFNTTVDNLNQAITELTRIITNTNSVIGVLTDEEVGKSLRRTMKNIEIFSKKIADNPANLINIFK